VNADSIAAGLSPFNPEGAAFESGRLMLKRIRQHIGDQIDFAFEKVFPKDENTIKGVKADVSNNMAKESPSALKAKETFGRSIQFAMKLMFPPCV
jgi:hypothetical protein